MRRLACHNEIDAFAFEEFQALRRRILKGEIRINFVRRQRKRLLDHPVRWVSPNNLGECLGEVASNDTMPTAKVYTSFPGTMMVRQDGIVDLMISESALLFREEC